MKPIVFVDLTNMQDRINATKARLAAIDAAHVYVPAKHRGDPVTTAVRSRRSLQLLGQRGIPILGRRWVLDVNRWQQRSVPKWGAGWVTITGGEEQGRRVGLFVASPHTTVSFAHLDW